MEKYRELEDVFHKGDLYRIVSPFEKEMSVLQFVSEDKNRVIVCVDCQRATFNGPDEYIKLEALDPDAKYRCGEKEYYGEYLMNVGIHYYNKFEHQSDMFVFDKI